MSDIKENYQDKLSKENDYGKVKNKILVLALIFIITWLIINFIVGFGLWNSDIPIAYGIMFSLFSVGSLISGILVGLTFEDLKKHKTAIITLTIFIFASLSLIAGVGRILGPVYLWEQLLPWVGVIGSSLNVVLVAFILQKIRLKLQRKQSSSIP